LLELDGNSKFRLAPSWEPILVNATDPHYLGSLVQILAEFTSTDFRLCLEAFRSGETVPFQGRGNIFARLVAETTAGLHAVIIRKILPLLPALFDRLNSGGTILDVGCGNGKLLIRLAEAFPQSKCVGVEIDQTGLALARTAIQEAAVSDRVEIIEGDIGAIAQANFVDLALMVEVLHEITPARRPGVIQECARVLRPGGWLILLDETYPSTIEEARHPEFRLALQTGFEELIWGNLIPTRREQELLLREAGFTGEIHRTLIGEGLTLLTTQRNETV
jgi:SAM-dependent methyltransferase